MANSFSYGLNVSSKEYDGKNKYIRITDIDDNSHKLIEKSLTSPNTNLEDISDYQLKENDLLLARTGASVGKSYLYDNTDGKAFFAGFLIRVKLNKKFDENFVFQNTLTNKYQQFVKVTSQRSGQPGINAKEYSMFKINVPKYFDEQKQIGNLLKKLDNTFELQQRQLDSYNKLKKGLLQKLFPKDREKLPEMRFAYFTGDWEQVKLSDLTKFHKQGFYTTESYNESKKYYLLRGTDLTGNKLAVHDDTPKINASEKEFNDFKVEVGDVLLVRSGGVGTYGIVYDEVQGIFGSYLIDFRFDQTQMLNEFFGYFYESDLFKQQLRRISQKSANLNINAENIKSISIDLPSIEEQKKIESILKQIDSLITLQQEKMNELEALKKYLLQKLFI